MPSPPATSRPDTGPVARSSAGVLHPLQWVGLGLFLLSACLPAFAWRHRIISSPTWGPREVAQLGTGGAPRVPLAVLAYGAVDASGEAGASRALWQRRPIYPYLLIPFWLGLALLARRHPRAAGGGFLVLAGAIAAFEAGYLRNDYEPFVVGLLGRFETFLAWVGVVVILFWRPPSRRGLDDVGALLGAQAMLALAHGLTLPVGFARDWFVQGGGWQATALRPGAFDLIPSRFHAGFWLALAGLALLAVPAYLSPGRTRIGRPR